MSQIQKFGSTSSTRPSFGHRKAELREARFSAIGACRSSAFPEESKGQ